MEARGGAGSWQAWPSHHRFWAIAGRRRMNWAEVSLGHPSVENSYLFLVDETFMINGLNLISSVKDFFISYNSADKSWAEWIAWQLEEAGYETILTGLGFQAGAQFCAPDGSSFAGGRADHNRYVYGHLEIRKSVSFVGV